MNGDRLNQVWPDEPAYGPEVDPVRPYVPAAARGPVLELAASWPEGRDAVPSRLSAPPPDLPVPDRGGRAGRAEEPSTVDSRHRWSTVDWRPSHVMREGWRFFGSPAWRVWLVVLVVAVGLPLIFFTLRPAANGTADNFSASDPVTDAPVVAPGTPASMIDSTGTASPAPATPTGTATPTSGATTTHPAAAAPVPAPTRAAVTYSALLGWACPGRSDGSTFTVGDQYSDGISGWYYPGGGGWTGDGCTGAFADMPMYGDPALTSVDPTEYARWSFHTGPVSSGTCTVQVYVPDDGVARDVDGAPARYVVLGGSGTQTGSFTVDQTAHRGSWVTAGGFRVTSAAIQVRLTNWGVDWVGDTLTYAHLAISAVRVNCSA